MPMVFIARAAAPMLPGWLGRHSTTRTRCRSLFAHARKFTQCVTLESLMHPLLNIAIKAARRAGAVINRAALDGSALEVRAKQANDFVTEVDHAAERAVIEVIRRAYPDHVILAEESGETRAAADAPGKAKSTKSDTRWIIDPLDGTTNFIHGFPQYAVSIAVEQRGRVAHAVVYDPSRNELFTAVAGPRRLAQRPPHPRHEMRALARRPGRHRLPVQGAVAHRSPTCASSATSCAARPASGAPAPLRSTSPTWPAAGSTGSGKWASRPGTWRPARC